MDMTLGTNIRKLRTDKGLTLNELAAQVGGEVGNISRLERDLQWVGYELLESIAAALQTPVAALFLDDGAEIRILNEPQIELLNLFNKLLPEGREAVMNIAKALPKAPGSHAIRDNKT